MLDFIHSPWFSIGTSVATLLGYGMMYMAGYFARANKRLGEANKLYDDALACSKRAIAWEEKAQLAAQAAEDRLVRMTGSLEIKP